MAGDIIHCLRGVHESVDGKASTAVVLSHLGSAAFTMASGGHFKIASEFAHHLAQTIVHVGTSTASPGDQAAVIRLSQILAKNSALVPVVFDVVQAKVGCRCGWTHAHH